MSNRKQFTMSMFANKEDLYKAKAEYYEEKLKELEIVVADVIKGLYPK